MTQHGGTADAPSVEGFPREGSNPSAGVTCDCGAGNATSARYGHTHLPWCVVALSVKEASAKSAYDAAMTKVRDIIESQKAWMSPTILEADLLHALVLLRAVYCPACGSDQTTKVHRPDIFEFDYRCRSCAQGFNA